MTFAKFVKFLRKIKTNRLIHKARLKFARQEVIWECSSPISGEIKVVDIGRERELVINGRTQTFILKNGSWAEVDRECWGYLSRPRFRVPPKPSVLLCGLGGGAAVPLLLKRLEPSHLTVIEIDPEIITLARKFFFVDQHKGVSILEGNALDVMKDFADAGRRFDCIIDDAFFEISSMTAAKEEQLMNLFSRLLSEAGVLTMNRAIDVKEDIAEINRFIKRLQDRGYHVKRKSIRQRWWNDIIYCKAQ